jgi:hypothetical protein
MKIGRILAGLLLIVGILFLAKDFWTEVEENRPPPTQYILFHDARVNDAKNGLTITNKNDFVWPKPIFTINGAYQNFYPENMNPGETKEFPYSDFKDDQGQSFPPSFQFHNFDIRTATMAMRKR